MGEAQDLTFEQEIQSSIADIYRAFTNSGAIQGWLCNNAQIDARENGRLYLHWNQGYYAVGTFIQVEAQESLSFTWRGRGEPAATQVRVDLGPENGKVKVTLVHSAVGTGDEWQTIREELKKGWTTGLANLKSVLETGLDKRIYDPPFLGIYISGVVDEKQAQQLDIPITSGIRIAGTVAGSGAEAAGFEANDILTQMGDVKLNSIQSIGEAKAGYSVGDKIDVKLYRGSQMHEISMTLSTRPRPDVPDTVKELATRLRQAYAELDAELDEIVSEISEGHASQAAEGEWNAREVLAHLIVSERVLQTVIALQLDGRGPAPFPTNRDEPIAALISVYPELADLVKAWKQAEAETVAIVERWPEEFVSRKADYLNLGNTLLNGYTAHTRGHFDQIRQAFKKIEE